MSADLKERVARVVREEVAPALEIDGTEIEVVDVSEGIAQVRFGLSSRLKMPTTIT